MDRLSAIWYWANRTGLFLKHKDLNVEQILELYGKTCVRSDEGFGWRVTDKSAESDQSVLPSLFSKKVVDGQRARL
jgi:hypothetical protein